jgi:hypothetical protein
MTEASTSVDISQRPKVRSLFAEMYVAAALADEDWSIYFPRRDVGFDMIATKTTKTGIVIRPIQVKGLYPSNRKTSKAYYGFVGALSQLHKDMALAIVYFDVVRETPSPRLIAWMPRVQVRRHSRGYKCQPAKFEDGQAVARRDFTKYFGTKGLLRMQSLNWR